MVSPDTTFISSGEGDTASQKRGFGADSVMKRRWRGTTDGLSAVRRGATPSRWRPTRLCGVGYPCVRPRRSSPFAARRGPLVFQTAPLRTDWWRQRDYRRDAGSDCNALRPSATILPVAIEHILQLLIQERDRLSRAIEALQGSPAKRRSRPPKTQALSATTPVPESALESSLPASIEKRKPFSAETTRRMALAQK